MKKITFLLAALMIATATAGAQDGDYWHRSDSSPDIEVWVNKGNNSTYYYGEDIAVYFRAEKDCYAVVYDINPAGEVTILFPSSPYGSSFVERDRVYRVPGYDDDYRLEIDGNSGRENIFAVASYEYIDPPDFIHYVGYDYGDSRYYDDGYFMLNVRGDMDDFVRRINLRLTGGAYSVAHAKFFVDIEYRHHSHYRYWDYDPYYVGSVWVGSSYPGCEVWIDGVFFGIAPILIPSLIIGDHWVWIYYGGYPCYQRYFHVSYYNRSYINVDIDYRFRDYRHRRNAFRDWSFYEKKYRNERDFRKRASESRDVKVRTRQLPEKLVRDFADRGVIDKDAPVVKKSRSGYYSDDSKNTRDMNRNTGYKDRANGKPESGDESIKVYDIKNGDRNLEKRYESEFQDQKRESSGDRQSGNKESYRPDDSKKSAKSNTETVKNRSGDSKSHNSSSPSKGKSQVSEKKKQNSNTSDDSQKKSSGSSSQKSDSKKRGR